MNKKKTDRLRSQFLNNISHELRTPLTCLKTYSDILKDTMRDKANESQVLCLNEIEHNVRRLLTEIELLLDLSKIENDKMLVKHETMNVKEQIYMVVKDMRPMFKQKNTKLIIKIEKMSELHIDSDSRAFRQIITNLINNALKNTPSGGAVHLRAEYKNEEFHCSISDQGSGIDPHNFLDVFEKYHYAPQKAALAVGGTGLGLVLCKELVGMLGGRIWVENNHEGGNTFFFTI